MWLGGNRTTPNHTKTYLTFDLTVRASHLWVAPYNDYQQYLYETIMEFREKGWNFQQIADWFNENGITTVTHPRHSLSEFPYEKPDRHHLPDHCYVYHCLNTSHLCRSAQSTDTAISAEKTRGHDCDRS